MTILTVFLYVLVVLTALLLIGLILIQPSKSGGMGAAFGGIGESVFGAKAGSHLTKTTVVMTTIFFVVALALAALIGHGAKLGSDSSNSGVLKELEKTHAEATVATGSSAEKKVETKTKNAVAPVKAAEKK